MAYLTEAALAALGVRFGDDVKVSVDARLYGAERLTIGSHVRIDAFCVVSTGNTGFVDLGSYIHIASGARIFGQGGVTFGDFATLSAGSTIYSASDDYSGNHLIGPTAPPPELTQVDERPVVLGRFAAVGAHSLLLPGVTMGEGSVLGAMSLASKDLKDWTIYGGSPCRALRPRARAARDLGARLDD